jgi:hypothetical protein
VQPKPGTGRRHRGGVFEPDPVVVHVEHGQVVQVGEGDGHPGGGGVLADVRQGFLDDAQQGLLNLGRERPGGPGDDRLGPQARLLTEPAGQLLERLGQRLLRQGPGPQRPHHPPGLGQVVAGRPQRLLDVAVHRAASGQGLLGRLQQQHHAGKALGEGVVQVAGQPLALGQRPGLPFGRGQLGPGRLQLLDQPLALPALADDGPYVGHRQQRTGREHTHGNDRGPGDGAPFLGQLPDPAGRHHQHHGRAVAEVV